MEATQEQMKYFGYVRKSSESDERQIQSLPDQLNFLKPLAQSREIEVREWLQEASSAKKPGRKIFSEMLVRIRDGEANGIIIYDPSRASRNATDSGSLIQMLDDGYLKEIVTPYQTFRNNSNDKFLFQLLCSMAKKDNDDKSEKVKLALQSRAERGLPIGPPRPGYRSIPGRKQGERGHEPDPIYFPLMKQLFRLYLSGTWSVMALTRKSQELDIRNFRGKLITKTCMFRLLSDPYYVGIIEYKGQNHQAQHVAMITPSEYDLIQNILKGKSRPRMIKREYALGGTQIKCAECGYFVIGDTHIKRYVSGKSQEFRYYRCSKRGASKCSQISVNADSLEAQAERFLSNLDIPQDFINLAIECIRDADKTKAEEKDAERRSAQAKYSNCVARLENLNQLYLSPRNTDKSTMAEDEYIELKDRLIKERNEALQALKTVDSRRDDDMDLAFKMFNFTVGIRDRFRNGTLEEKKRVMQVIGSNLTLLDQKLYIQARKPFIIIKEAFDAIKPENKQFELKDGLLESSNPQVRSDLYRVRNEVRTYLNTITPVEKKFLMNNI